MEAIYNPIVSNFEKTDKNEWRYLVEGLKLPKMLKNSAIFHRLQDKSGFSEGIV